MNIQLQKKEDFIQKKEILNSIKIQLKSSFIGIDHVIDEVMNLVTAWYLFPDAQLRPTVINLWGLTGSGKTALVLKLITLLEHEKLFAMFDMGEFESDSASWFKNILTDDLEFFHEKPGIICLDEFQFARTINKNGDELGKDKLRVIWDLLDSGNINYIPSGHTYYIERSEACITRILKAKERGVIMKNGSIVDNEEQFMQIFYGFFFENESRNGEPLNKDYFLSSDFIDGIYYLNKDNKTTKEILKDSISNAEFEDIIDLIVEGLKTRVATKHLDLKKCLIFVLGNLDEAYQMSRSINPDISADDLHEATCKITIAQIKEALQKRFRNEQIARLGNNHIIYKSFKKEHFKEFIRKEVSKIGQYILTQFELNVHFHDSVFEVIYLEGVFPAQGTRPVLTTIKNLIEPFISKLILEIIELQLNVDSVEWSYTNELYCFVYKNENGETIHNSNEKVLLKTEKLRQVSNINLQAHTAVHESGHAVLAVMTTKILPSVVVSKSAANSCEGFCLINLPTGISTKESIKNDIIISLGGLISERLIFGDENTSSGTESDLQNATEQANRAIRQYGMGKDPIRVALESSDNEDMFYNHEHYLDEAMCLIKECENEAKQILINNKLLLLKMSEYLMTNARMEAELIAEYVKKYSTAKWIHTDGFKDKENYYNFSSSILKQIEELEKDLMNQSVLIS